MKSPCTDRGDVLYIAVPTSAATPRHNKGVVRTDSPCQPKKYTAVQSGGLFNWSLPRRLAGISAAEGAAPCLSCQPDSPAAAAAMKGASGGVGERWGPCQSTSEAGRLHTHKHTKRRLRPCSLAHTIHETDVQIGQHFVPTWVPVSPVWKQVMLSTGQVRMTSAAPINPRLTSGHFCSRLHSHAEMEPTRDTVPPPRASISTGDVWGLWCWLSPPSYMRTSDEARGANWPPPLEKCGPGLDRQPVPS